MFGHTREAQARPATLRFDAPARADSIGLARKMVRAWLDGPDDAWDDVIIVVSELMTNAVRYGGLDEDETVQLTIAREDDGVRVEVDDRGAGFDPEGVRGAAPTSIGGLGLKIVEALSQSWGYVPEGRVWAKVSRGGASAAATRGEREQTGHRIQDAHFLSG